MSDLERIRERAAAAAEPAAELVTFHAAPQVADLMQAAPLDVPALLAVIDGRDQRIATLEAALERIGDLPDDAAIAAARAIAAAAEA